MTIKTQRYHRSRQFQLSSSQRGVLLENYSQLIQTSSDLGLFSYFTKPLGRLSHSFVSSHIFQAVQNLFVNVQIRIQTFLKRYKIFLLTDMLKEIYRPFKEEKQIKNDNYFIGPVCMHSLVKVIQKYFLLAQLFFQRTKTKILNH